MLTEFLSEKSTEGASFGNPAQFWVDTRTASPSYAIFAPNGGMVEPGTDICAAQIAGNDLSLHTVVSCRAIWDVEKDHGRLIPRPMAHHPDGVALAQKSRTVVSIRGRHASHTHAGEVCIDGLDLGLVDSLTSALTAFGFIVRGCRGDGLARHPGNICNYGVRQRGVELDISHELMSRLLNDTATMLTFVRAVRTGFETALPEC